MVKNNINFYLKAIILGLLILLSFIIIDGLVPNWIHNPIWGDTPKVTLAEIFIYKFAVAPLLIGGDVFFEPTPRSEIDCRGTKMAPPGPGCGDSLYIQKASIIGYSVLFMFYFLIGYFILMKVKRNNK